MKVKTSKGFTLAELLIVMAIIVVLAAVAIPTFGRQLETARETGDMELIRNAYTDALSLAIIDASDGTLDGLKNADDDTPIVASTDANFKITKTTADTKVVYCVKLAEATRQTKTTWDYVNNTVAGQTVPALTALYDGYVKFTFALDTTSGGVTWASGEGVTPIATASELG